MGYFWDSARVGELKCWNCSHVLEVLLILGGYEEVGKGFQEIWSMARTSSDFRNTSIRVAGFTSSAEAPSSLSRVETTCSSSVPSTTASLLVSLRAANLLENTNGEQLTPIN